MRRSIAMQGEVGFCEKGTKDKPGGAEHNARHPAKSE